MAAAFPRRWRSTAADPLGLTRRQRALAELLASGLSRPAAARVMGISPATAMRHSQGVYRALGVHSRAELVERLRAARPALSEPFARELSDDECAWELDVRTYGKTDSEAVP